MKIDLSAISKKLRQGAEYLDSLHELDKKLTEFLYKAKAEIESELEKKSKNNHQE